MVDAAVDLVRDHSGGVEDSGASALGRGFSATLVHLLGGFKTG